MQLLSTDHKIHDFDQRVDDYIVTDEYNRQQSPAHLVDTLGIYPKTRISEREHYSKTKSSVKIQANLAKFDYIIKTVIPTATRRHRPTVTGSVSGSTPYRGVQFSVHKITNSTDCTLHILECRLRDMQDVKQNAPEDIDKVMKGRDYRD